MEKKNSQRCSIRNLLVIAGLLLMTLGTYAQGKTITGKVMSVTDGDTFTLLTTSKITVRIRLHGIDCPEKKQSYGMAAKKFTSDLIFGKDLTIKPTDIDRYGRTIAIVYLSNGKILNELLLNNGLAWHYIQYDKNKKWSTLERLARERKIGLWQQSESVAPWSYRKNKKYNYKF